MLAGAAAVILVFYVVLAAKLPRTALLTAPVAAICFLVLSYADGDEITLGFSILMPFTTVVALAVLSPRDKKNWARTVAVWILRGIAALPVLAVAGVLWPLTVLLLPVFVTIFLRYYFVARHSTALFVVSTIGACMRQNLPLAMALETAAANNYDKRSRVLRGISLWLVQGYSLSEAIRRGYRGCPAHAVATIAAAEKIGQLPEALRSVEADMVEKADENRKIRPVDWSYPLIVMSIMAVIMTGLMIFIVPIFASVLADMSDGTVRLPHATQVLLNFANVVTTNYIVIGLLICCGTSIPAVLFYVRFRPRRPERPHLLSRAGDFLKWHFPFSRWFETRYSLLQVVSLLRVSLNTGATVDAAIRSTLGLDTNCFFRRRLAAWLGRVEQGDNVAIAARRSGLPRAVAYAFNTEVNGGDTVAILRVLEEFYRSTYNFRANVVKSATVPMMVVGLGGMVGFVIYAMFLPMVTILWVMTADVMP